tara:strand:- start:5092 stop:5547 length:456 start_codon:yes stop_codon:yes gene_type:complete
MKFLILFFFLILLSCSNNKVVNNHGVLSLEKKSNKIFVSKSNKNDVLEVLGPPSIVSTFNDNTWIYIERKKVNQSVFKLGKKKIQKNNILIVQLNNYGILENKKFYDMSKMNKLKFDKELTKQEYSKDTFLYNFLSSFREKINSPVKRRKK